MLSRRWLGKTWRKAEVTRSNLLAQPRQNPWRCSCKSRRLLKQPTTETKSSYHRSKSTPPRAKIAGVVNKAWLIRTNSTRIIKTSWLQIWARSSPQWGWIVNPVALVPISRSTTCSHRMITKSRTSLTHRKRSERQIQISSDNNSQLVPLLISSPINSDCF